MASVEDKKAFLLKQDADGNCVYDHITDLLVSILEEQPKHAVDSFELRSTKAKLPKAAKLPSVTPYPPSVARAQDICDMFVPPPPPADEDGVVPEVEPPAPNLRLTQYNAAMFEKAGAGLGAAESYRLQLAMKALSEDEEKGAGASIKFWGKISGISANYYICEIVPAEFGEPVEQTDEEKAAKVTAPEDPGTGANAKVYYVCQELGPSCWSRLPDVRPEHIMGARAIKKLFSGDLTKKIEGYPVFPGTEAELLRAQIARISADTTIAPAGLFHIVGDEEEDFEYDATSAEVEPTEGFEPPADLIELVHPSKWVHQIPQLLETQGRCTWFDAYADDEEPEDEDAPKPVKPEPEQPARLLQSLSDDARIGKVPAWTFRVCGSALPSSAIAVAKSVAWPGAMTVAELGSGSGVTFTSVYFGDGMSFSAAPYTPPLPPAVEMEFDDTDMCEQTDPTPEEEAAAAAATTEGEGEEE